jgi:hypothetical protein
MQTVKYTVQAGDRGKGVTGKSGFDGNGEYARYPSIAAWRPGRVAR